jgi:hypothetical protein
LFANNPGRKKIYAHAVNLRANVVPTEIQTINIFITLTMIIDRSQIKTLKSDSFGDFFITVLNDVKKIRDTSPAEQWQKCSDQLKSFKLKRINDFVDNVIFGKSIVEEDSE